MIDKNKKGFVCVDLDGTLCNIEHRIHHVKKTPKDWKSFFEAIPLDKPREDVLKMVYNYIELGYEIIFLSARPDTYRKQTEEWLSKNFLKKYFTLIMRRGDDKRPDTDVKKQIFETYFKDKYPIEVVIDDRPSVIRMWKENGLDVIDVGNGVEF